MTTSAAAAPGRVPLPALAAILSLLAPTIGMLYVKRPWWALAYFLIELGYGLLLLAMVSFDIRTISDGALLIPWILKIAGAVQAFIVARRAVPGERPWYSRWYGLAGVATIPFAAVFVIRAFVFEPFRGASASMHPTIPPGSMLYVSKLGYGNYGAYGINLPKLKPTKHLERTDVVAYRRPDDPQLVVVSRVIGLPGDHIQYLDRQLMINGARVAQSASGPDDAREGIHYRYATEIIDGHRIAIAWIPERVPRDADAVVPPGQYMMLGDSRDNARDSRYIGMIPRANVLGVVRNFQPAALEH